MNTHGIRPNKRAGQNFLKSPATAKKFVDIVSTKLKDKPQTVVEIGPGIGAITEHLCGAFENVIAIEKDKRLLKFWAEKEDRPENLTVIDGDATNFDFAKLSKELGFKLLVFGNLPFNVSTLILERLIEQWRFVDKALLTFQNEVAQRILSKPDCRDYGSLTVLAQTYTNPSSAMFIGKKQYFPIPKIDSRVVLFEFLDVPRVKEEDQKKFEHFVRQLFLYRRKTLTNGIKLAPAFTHWKEPAIAYLEEKGLPANSRIETWDFESIYSLFSYCLKMGDK
jgi:16S rRNA (adenine1518-N6/adenine1519-N6)-dimethyltransferase